MLVQPAQPHPSPTNSRGGDILVCGFASTVAVWITAYLCRMPVVNAPAQVTLACMLAMVFLGGLLAARYAQRGLSAALLAGALSGALDILILGSKLFDTAGRQSVAPAAALWISGSILCNALVAGIGGAFGTLLPSPRRARILWTQIFALVLTVATLPLITAGGLVTAFRAGLAVPDWPQSYGYNMFLFPLSKMQSAQGNFYEHAHRLMGFLVGLTALTLAIYATFADRRRAIRNFAWIILAAVFVQGVLGGLRVNEKSLALAIVHGIFAQMTFAAMACLTAAAGRTFHTASRSPRHAAVTDRRLSALLVAALLTQLTLGALVRHADALLVVHVTMAALVACLAIACGFRAWGLYGDLAPLRKTGLTLMAVVTLQLLLGIIALAFRAKPNQDPTLTSAFLTTAHQANGAFLLAVSALLLLWNRRLLAPHPLTDAAPALPPNPLAATR